VLLYVKLHKPSGGDSFASNTPGQNPWDGMRRMPGGGPGMPNGDANPFGGGRERTFTFPGGDRSPGGRDGGKDGGRSRMGGFTPGSTPGMPATPWTGGGEGSNPFSRMPGMNRERGDKSGRDDKDSKRDEQPKFPFGGKKGKR
jgi:hypothetical protein